MPEFVDYPFLANVTRVNVAALASLALAPERPKDVRIVTRRLTNDTDLQWAAKPTLLQRGSPPIKLRS